MFFIDHDELKSHEEVDLVGGFFQIVHDWGDIGADLDPSHRVATGFHLTQILKELEEAGFFVFGGREVQLIEGGIQTESSNWPVSIFKVLRKGNDKIIEVDSTKLHQNISSSNDFLD